MSAKNKVSQKSKKTAKTAVTAVKSKRTAVVSKTPRASAVKSKKVPSAEEKADGKQPRTKEPSAERKAKKQRTLASQPSKAVAKAPSAKIKKMLEQGSAIFSTGRKVGTATSILQDHGDIAKGIAERKAAAKAKSIARLSRPAAEKNTHRKKLTAKQSKDYENMLLRLRDEISRQIAFLRGASLTRSDEVNPEEDGSDAFERQLALKLASNEGDAVFEIDEALQRIKEGVYGICQDCGCVISPARLKALPFARRCVVCKTVAEKDRSVSDRRYF